MPMQKRLYVKPSMKVYQMRQRKQLLQAGSGPSSMSASPNARMTGTFTEEDW